ncbi:MAG: hypothetical protein K2J48_02535 [Muribaculaceae bacterium]|nr:hypothetical protein [Muribaculaceae bacterium]
MRNILHLVILLIIVGCNNGARIDQQLDRAERLTEVAPDSAIAILDSVCEELSGGINEKKARANLLIAKAKLKQGKSFLTVENFDEMLGYYEATGDSAALIDAFQLAAKKMVWENKRDSAIYYLRRAIDLSSDSSTPSRSNIYIELSNLYATPSLDKDYRKAIEYAKEAFFTASTTEDKARSLHDIGVFYSFANQNDSAILYMERALSEVDPSMGPYTQMALNYANTPKADFKKSIRYLNNIKGESLGKLITLGFLYLNESQLDSSQHYYMESKILYNENPAKYSINTYNNLRLLEQSLVLTKTGVAMPYEGTMTNDSISEVSSFQNMIAEERRTYNNKLQLNLMRQKFHRRSAWIVGLSTLLTIICIFGGYVWHSKRKYMLLKKKLEEVKIEQIVSEANPDNSEEETTIRLIRQRMEICIEQFRTLKLQAALDRIEMEYRADGSYPSIKNREHIQKRLIGCFADFIVDLKMTGIKLSMEDIITCILSSLRASNATIAGCLGVTDSAVRTRKSRLRTKLPDKIINLLDL